jgi:hypothetical protein
MQSATLIVAAVLKHAICRQHHIATFQACLRAVVAKGQVIRQVGKYLHGLEKCYGSCSS